MWRICRTGIIRPPVTVSSGIAFHPLSASLAAAGTRPGFYFATQPGAAGAVPGLVTSTGIVPATSLAGGTVISAVGAREGGMIS